MRVDRLRHGPSIPSARMHVNRRWSGATNTKHGCYEFGSPRRAVSTNRDAGHDYFGEDSSNDRTRPSSSLAVQGFVTNATRASTPTGLRYFARGKRLVDSA